MFGKRPNRHSNPSAQGKKKRKASALYFRKRNRAVREMQRVTA